MEISLLYNHDFVTDEEVLGSKKFDELKKEMVSEKAEKIFEKIEEIESIEDEIYIYKIKNMEEWEAAYIYFTDNGYTFESELEIFFDGGCCYIINSFAYDFLLVYNPKTIKKFREDLQKQLSFVSD